MIDRLPPELLFHIISCTYGHQFDGLIAADVSFTDLPDKDVTSLQLVCRSYLPLARANKTWRERCYDKSPAVKIRGWSAFADTLSRPTLGGNSANEAASTFASILQTAEAGSVTSATQPTAASGDSLTLRHSRLRAIADWDPSYESEKVDWYSEYIARAAPLSISWTINPINEVKGLALLKNDAGGRAIGPCEDGTVRIWDVYGGQEVGKSTPGMLFKDTSSLNGAVECVSVDSARGTACFAVLNELKTVDLSTLQITSSHDFTYPIAALSYSDTDGQPLTVGTKFSVHLFDPREQGAALIPEPLTRVDSPPSPTLAAGDSCPLSILHIDDHSIYLAGRYPSILHYDRRYFPRLESTIHSGGRLCSLSHIRPPPQNPNSLTSPSSTLLSCGEYNGRGSLELYNLTHHQEDHPPPQAYRNRQTASRSKLLSVSPHGTRIVFSDADGGLKWVERDGHSLTRSWNVNQFNFVERPQPSSRLSGASRRSGGVVLEFGTQGTDVVRKILPLPSSQYGPHISSGPGGTRGDNELLLYTGEKAGILHFRERDEDVFEDAREDFEDELNEIGTTTMTTTGRRHGATARETGGAHHAASGPRQQQREMEEAMKRALMRHADEMNWLRRFGLAPEV